MNGQVVKVMVVIVLLMAMLYIEFNRSERKNGLEKNWVPGYGTVYKSIIHRSKYGGVTVFYYFRYKDSTYNAEQGYAKLDEDFVNSLNKKQFPMLLDSNDVTNSRLLITQEDSQKFDLITVH